MLMMAAHNVGAKFYKHIFTNYKNEIYFLNQLCQITQNQWQNEEMV